MPILNRAWASGEPDVPSVRAVLEPPGSGHLRYRCEEDTMLDGTPGVEARWADVLGLQSSRTGSASTSAQVESCSSGAFQSCS